MLLEEIIEQIYREQDELEASDEDRSPSVVGEPDARQSPSSPDCAPSGRT